MLLIKSKTLKILILTNNFHDYTLILNGRLLDVCENIINLLELSRKKITFRASPNGKQIYISMMQKINYDSGGGVMMIGDGSNDIAALIQSNIGISIGKEGNNNVKNVSEIVIDNWCKIQNY